MAISHLGAKLDRPNQSTIQWLYLDISGYGVLHKMG